MKLNYENIIDGAFITTVSLGLVFVLSQLPSLVLALMVVAILVSLLIKNCKNK